MTQTKTCTDVPTPSYTETEQQDLYRMARSFAEELTCDWGERTQIARDYVSAPVEDPDSMVCTDPSDDASPLPWCMHQRLLTLLKEKGVSLPDALERLGFTRMEAERPLSEAYASKLWAERKDLLD